MKILLALVALGIAGIAFAAPPEPDAGAAIFARSCAMCHAVAPGAPAKLGPTLAALDGRKAGTVPGFRYSPAMANAGISWNAETLDGFLAKPSAVIPGNRMGFGGIAAPADRAAVIAYLTRGK